jgi:hypothetical protein
VGAPLEAKHAGQLFRYFTVSEARFGVLTDGARYLFYTDLEAPNKMDERSFFEFNLLDFNEASIDELKKFTKTAFDVDNIVSTASTLKYLRALLTEVKAEFANPSEEMVRLLISRVMPGVRFTAQVKEQYAELTRRALDAFLKEAINLRLKSAMDTSESLPSGVAQASLAQVESVGDTASDEPDVQTTQDENDAFRIIQAIGSEIVDPEDIVMRDAKSYCAVLYKDNNRRPIARLYFNRKKALQIGLFKEDGEVKSDIERLTDIFKHRAAILDGIRQYLPKAT